MSANSAWPHEPRLNDPVMFDGKKKPPELMLRGPISAIRGDQ
jgi:hypothetical protein